MIFELMRKIYKIVSVFIGLIPSRSFLLFVRADVSSVGHVNDSKIRLKNIDTPIAKTFNAFDNIVSQPPSIKAGGGVKLWKHFPLPDSQGTFSHTAGPADYADIPANWK